MASIHILLPTIWVIDLTWMPAINRQCRCKSTISHWLVNYYLVPFLRYSNCFYRVWTFDLYKSSKVIFYTIRKPIYAFLFHFYGHHLSILYRFWENTGQHVWGRKNGGILNLKIKVMNWFFSIIEKAPHQMASFEILRIMCFYFSSDFK